MTTENNNTTASKTAATPANLNPDAEKSSWLSWKCAAMVAGGVVAGVGVGYMLWAGRDAVVAVADVAGGMAADAVAE